MTPMYLKTLTIWLAFAANLAISQDRTTEPLRVYFIGNSVTDTIQYSAFAELAESQNQPIVWGRHMIPGAPLEWIHSHPDSGFMQEPFGHYPKALGEFAWDAVSLQPFDRHLRSGKDSDDRGDHGDVAMIRDFAKRAVQRNPEVQLYIYARWPRITVDGKGLDFDKNDYDPKRPGSGADLSSADSYASRWNADYTGGWDNTNETRDYFDQLLSEVNSQAPFLNRPAKIVPVGEVMYELDRKMIAGEVPGYSSVYQLYRDGIHLGELGSYLVACTYYATLTKRSPVGLTTQPYGDLDAAIAEIIQQVAWEVVSPRLTAEETATSAVEAPSAAAIVAAADYSERHRGQSMIVMFDGKVIFERYANGGQAERLQMLASGSKSFIGIAAGAAADDGLFQLDDPVADCLLQWKQDPQKRLVTYRQLLTLTSGLKASGVGFGRTHPSWQESADGPMTGEPGRQFAYGANQLNVFAFALQQSLKDETFEEYLKRRIADPLGISIHWRVRCRDGNPQVGGGGFATSRDWAKFGEFVRKRGMVNGKQIVNAERIEECFQGTAANPAYGMTWWLKNPVTQQQVNDSRILASEWADAANSDWLPDDLVAACGAGKQRLYVIPSRKLVIVRQATLPNREFSDTDFLRPLFGQLETTD